MKTPDSKPNQETQDTSENISEKNETPTEVKENAPDEELRIVDEKNMIGQPMGNHVQNSNYKHQTPKDRVNEKNFSEGDNNSMKEQQQAQTPPIDVIQSIKDSSGKPQSDI